MGLISHFSDLGNLFLTLRLVNPRGNPSDLTQLALTVPFHVSVMWHMMLLKASTPST